LSPTPDATLSFTPVPTLSSTPDATLSFTVVPTFSSTPVATVSASPLRSPPATLSDTPTPASTPVPTATPGVVGTLAWTLKVYDASGWLLRSVDAGLSQRPVRSFNAGPQPYDPSQGPLHLGNGDWSYDYDGRDSNGTQLGSGVYQLVLLDRSGTVQALKTVEVLGAQGATLAVKAGPNPVGAGVDQVQIVWTPPLEADLLIYDQAGQLVRDLGPASPPRIWNLRGSGGAASAGGVYLVAVRVPGQRSSQWCKVAVAR
jgi:hypothetical protein